ncbi:LOW QUALITY PROTEIN: enolase 4 [Leptodactylus fuscus]|uniref:LOW QUALITY PROTEIN: enolase 4 n=1 Tax=Leptodactylus fuscus TaxID=238119 RepID=UPI003F4EA894
MSCGATAGSHTQQTAAEYYRSRRVPERLEEALNTIYHRGAADVYGQLSCYFADLSDPPVISDVRGRKVFDGAGKTTLEAAVMCTVRTVNKRICTAAIPVDSALLPTGEVSEDTERLESVETAIRWIQESIGPALRGKRPSEQSAIDQLLRALQEIPLYSHIAGLKQQQQPPPELALPTPLISVLSCAKSSPGKLNLMKEILVIPKPGTEVAKSLDLASSLQKQILKQVETQSRENRRVPSLSDLSVFSPQSPLGCPHSRTATALDQPLELIGDACERLGLDLGTSVYLAINCAAHQLMDDNKGRYEIASGTWKSPEEMVRCTWDLIHRHPAIMALVDPLRKEDRQQWDTLGKAIGSRCYLLADVAMRSRGDLQQGSDPLVCSGPILKLTNETTVSDLLMAVRGIEGENRLTILGSSCEECAEESLVDLAVGLGVRFIHLGGLLRGERAAKYNRLLQIEEDLTRSGTLGRQEEFEFPALWNNMEVSTLG